MRPSGPHVTSLWRLCGPRPASECVKQGLLALAAGGGASELIKFCRRDGDVPLLSDWSAGSLITEI